MNKSLIGIIIAVIVIGGFIVFNKKNDTNKKVSDAISVDVTPVVNPEFVSKAEESQAGKQMFLTITSPANNSTVSTSSITVIGKTLPDAEVFVNDISLLADKDGNFSAPVTLGEGDNEILILANDAAGNVANDTLVINYVP